MTEQTLSDKVSQMSGKISGINNIYEEEDVKDFIKKLKEKISDECKMCTEYPTTIDLIDKLAGEKLI
jgi:putative IMPACT (imprinted ancient) family translation regulator